MYLCMLMSSLQGLTWKYDTILRFRICVLPVDILLTSRMYNIDIEFNIPIYVFVLLYF